MNKVKGYETWVLFDEFQTFMDWPIAAQYFLKAWMEGRKYDLYQTGATQNVLAVLENAKASRALDNSGVVTMYNMAHDDARELAEPAHMSERPDALHGQPARGPRRLVGHGVGHAVQRLLAQGHRDVQGVHFQTQGNQRASDVGHVRQHRT